MKKFELHYTTGDYVGQWYTAWEGQSSLDIASATAGQETGQFLSTSGVPNGEVDQVRQTIYGYFIVNVTVSYSAATYYSKADGSATTSSPAVDATIPLKGPSGVPMDSVTSAQNVSMTISDTQSPKANATFNLLSSNGDGTSGCVGIRDTGPGPTYEVAPRQPNVSVTITY